MLTHELNHTLERVRYFSRQLITADDMLKEQEYFRQKLRRHNRYLHGWGVVCGCKVAASPSKEPQQPWRVKICPGYVITPQGDEIEIPAGGIYFNLAGDWRQAYDPCSQPSPCPPASGNAASGDNQKAYLAVCYAECSARPVRIQADGCSCDDTACEYSRIRESFELVRLLELPESHTLATKADQVWTEWVEDDNKPKAPLPNCPECPDDTCVVLAMIKLPAKMDSEIKDDDISYDGRRVLHSAT